MNPEVLSYSVHLPSGSIIDVTDRSSINNVKLLNDLSSGNNFAYLPIRYILATYPKESEYAIKIRYSSGSRTFTAVTKNRVAANLFQIQDHHPENSIPYLEI